MSRTPSRPRRSSSTSPSSPASHKGWDGEKTWASAGGDVKLAAIHDQVNTTRLNCTLTGGVVPRWSVFSEIHSDPFRFDQVARNLALWAGELYDDEYDVESGPVRREPRELAKKPIKRIGTPEQQQLPR